MAEVVSSMLTGATFCCWILFLFSHSKACDVNIAIFVNSVCSRKPLIAVTAADVKGHKVHD